MIARRRNGPATQDIIRDNLGWILHGGGWTEKQVEDLELLVRHFLPARLIYKANRKQWRIHDAQMRAEGLSVRTGEAKAKPRQRRNHADKGGDNS